MARNKKRSFFKGMLIYALVFLAAAAAGLAVFWNYIDAYERSRPKNTVDAYIASLTPEDICRKSAEYTAMQDGNLQSPEEREAVIAASLTERVTYARKSAESTTERQVYVLRCGSQVIGQLVISAGEPDRYGFTEWVVAEDSFDFSHLLGQPLSVTVPKEFTVCANGHVLDDRYITESGMEYSALEEFYDDYQLPTLVTYTVEGYLGGMELSVSDEKGTPVSVTEETDWNLYLDNCTREEQAQVETFMEDFLECYVTFTGSANRSAKANYQRLRKNFLIPDSALAQRLYTALDGLAYAKSNGDRLDDVAFHRFTRIEDDRYFCDVTYTVITYGTAGKVQTSNNMKVMLVMTEDGLRVEAMTRY